MNINNPFGQAPEEVKDKPPIDPNNPYAHEPPLLDELEIDLGKVQ